MVIKNIEAYEILASGGFPTVEVKVVLESGVEAKASVPYGASAGSFEAFVLNDNDLNRYTGKGVLKAVNNVNSIIAKELKGINVKEQKLIDEKLINLDGTENKSNLGANAILAVSLAVAKAASAELKKPLYKHITDIFEINNDFSYLPNPMAVVIEGGKHADETTDLQEYCLTAISKESVTENIRKVMEAYHQLKIVLKENNLSTNVGNEGAFAPNGIQTNESPFEYILKAIEKAGYIAGKDLGISIDAAASEFFKENKYHLSIENKFLTSEELIKYYEKWFQKYPIVTIEDMLDENDWENWIKLNIITKKYTIDLIGDDLTVTNVKRLQKAIDLNAISSILIKLNQIGTLTETVETCLLAKAHGISTITSHRGGGETNDTSMVDLAVAVGSRFIKVGPSRGERVCKYNRLMEIERELRR